MAGKAMAGWQPALAARFGVHYGWVVVAVTLPTLLVAAGLRASPGVIIRPWEAEFGWDRAAISTIIAVSWIAYGIANPLAGRFLDTLGPRRVTLASIGLATAGAIGTVLVRDPWQLYLVWGVAVGLGAGGAANVLAATVANRWFATKRGLVTGILGGGSSAGQLIFLPTLMALTIADGWRSGLILLAALLGFLIIPLVFLFLRDSPAEVGLRPYGAASASGSSAGPVGAAARATPIREAVRTSDFWFLAGSFFICGYTTNGLIGTHLIPHAVEHGIPEVTTASVLGLMGMMNILGTIASGMLVDRFDARRMLAAYYTFRGLSLFLLPFVQDAGMLSVFAVIYGLDWLATVPPTISLTADRFGRGSVGSIYGWISLSHQLGGAIAAAMGGYVYVMMGSYNAAFISAGVTAVIAAGLALGVRRTRLPLPAGAPA
jgi:MFS family permease